MDTFTFYLLVYKLFRDSDESYGRVQHGVRPSGPKVQ